MGDGAEGSPRPTSASLSAMYQDVILRHYRAPQGRGALANATATAERKNPLCGDQIAVSVAVHDGVIAEVAFEGRGCSIATASASMLTEAVRGVDTTTALALATRVGRLVRGEAEQDYSTAKDFGDLQCLAGVTPYASRHGCALMAWQALTESLEM